MAQTMSRCMSPIKPMLARNSSEDLMKFMLQMHSQQGCGTQQGFGQHMFPQHMFPRQMFPQQTTQQVTQPHVPSADGQCVDGLVCPKLGCDGSLGFRTQGGPGQPRHLCLKCWEQFQVPVCDDCGITSDVLCGLRVEERTPQLSGFGGGFRLRRMHHGTGEPRAACGCVLCWCGVSR